MSKQIAIHKVNKLEIVKQTREKNDSIPKKQSNKFLQNIKKVVKDFVAERFRIPK